MTYTYFFRDDYSEGAHPQILKALAENNLQQESGYGTDSFSQHAEQLIRKKIGKPEANVHFVTNGTQANLISLASILRPYEFVIMSEVGHPYVHEGGAVEATGHKIQVVFTKNGKLTAQAVQNIVDKHNNEHTGKPQVVYISQATELGTVYTKQEMQELSNVCKQNGLYFYIDGARIGNAIMSKGADFDLPTIADLCDIFFIGGTKNGALLGEAIVITNPELKENFRYHLKQHGALLAKGRVISKQFIELFKDNLYFENAKHANEMAQKLAEGIKKLGHSFLSDTSTNQIFPILPNIIIEKLEQKYAFYIWSKSTSMENSSAIRLVTSWATTEDAVETFLKELGTMH